MHLIHELVRSAGLDTYNPVNPQATPYVSQPFNFPGFKMPDFGADSPSFPLPHMSSMPTDGTSSSFMPHGADALENIGDISSVCHLPSW
jgi:hypothetical protein